MNEHNAPPSSADISVSAATQGLQRRAALLKGLRAGGVAAAGGVSLNAFAARVVAPNGKGCTVSAQVSAAVSMGITSSIAPAPCGGFAPGSLVQADPVAFEAPKKQDYSISAGGAKLLVSDTYVVVQDAAVNGNGKSGTKLSAKGWPNLDVAPGRATVATLFGGSDAAPLLYVLSLRNDLSYFVAAYFSAALAVQPAGTSHVPFTTEDVKRYYNGGSLSAEAISLFRLVCVG